MMTTPLRLLVVPGLVSALAVTGCSHSTRVPRVSEERPANEYRYQLVQDSTRQGENDNFLAATFSGGGMRASALAYGALKAFASVRRNAHGGATDQSTLIDQFDFVSAVSGGSVTAAYWALHGSENLPELEERFLTQNVQGDLVTDLLNPVTLVSLPFPHYSRIDILSDYLATSDLFGRATYNDLSGKPDRPYLVINATDMGTRSLFPFIQLQFDLLCADLGGLLLADAVAASAAYPIVFSALTLENHRTSTTGATRDGDMKLDESCLEETLQQDLEDKLENERKAADAAEMQVRKEEENVQRAEMKLDEAGKTVEQLLLSHKEAEVQRQNLEEKLRVAKSIVEDLESKKDAIGVEIEELKEEQTQTDARVRESEKKHDDALRAVEDAKVKIEEARKGVRDLNVDVDDPVPILVRVWWQTAVTKEDDTKAIELAERLVESYGVLRSPARGLEGVRSRHPARRHLRGGEEERQRSAQEEVHKRIQESTLELVDYWCTWVEDLQHSGLYDIAVGERESVRQEFPLSDDSGESRGSVVAGKRSQVWEMWIRELVEQDDETAENFLSGKWWIEFAGDLWAWIRSGDELARVQEAAARVASLVVKVTGESDSLGMLLDRERSLLESLEKEYRDAIANAEAVGIQLTNAEDEENRLHRELVDAREQEVNKSKELREIQAERERLQLYLERVTAIRTEFDTVAANYSEQIGYYGRNDAEFVHLLDGGAADNLGFTSLLEILDDFRATPDRKVEHAAILVVDARAEPANTYATERESPGILDTIRTVTGTAIDSKSFLLARELDHMMTRLERKGAIEQRHVVYVGFQEITAHDGVQGTEGVSVGPLANGVVGKTAAGEPRRGIGVRTGAVFKETLVECQRKFEEIETNWSLALEDVEALINLGELLVRESRDFNALIDTLDAEPAPVADTVASLCERYVGTRG